VKNRGLFVILGSLALAAAIIVGALVGGVLVYFSSPARSVQASASKIDNVSYHPSRPAAVYSL